MQEESLEDVVGKEFDPTIVAPSSGDFVILAVSQLLTRRRHHA